MSDFKKEQVQKLAISMSTVCMKAQEPQLQRLVDVPADSVKILVNVNDSFLQESSECRTLLGFAETYLTQLLAADSATFYFYNYPENNVLFYKDDAVCAFEFNANSQLGTTINTLKRTRHLDNSTEKEQLCYPMVSSFGNAIGALMVSHT